MNNFENNILLNNNNNNNNNNQINNNNNENIFSSSITVKIILIIALTLITIDFIQIISTLNYLQLSSEILSKEIFNSCVKYQKITDIFFSMFGMLSGISASIICLTIMINIDIFNEKFGFTFLYFNYMIFGPYLLISCLLAFYYFDQISFYCDSKNNKIKYINFSTIFCLIFSVSFSLTITTIYTAFDNIENFSLSIRYDRNGNYLLGKIFWYFISYRNNNNNNNQNNNNNNNNNNNQNNNNNINNNNNLLINDDAPLLYNIHNI